MTDKDGWLRSSRSADGADCVEVRRLVDGDVELRDSETPETVISIPRGSWEAFRESLRLGEFDHI